MGAESEQRGGPAAWDRVGWMLEDTGSLALIMSKRMLELWNTVSQNLRQDAYTADAMAQDTARAMRTAMDNMDDMWTFLTRPVQRERVATGLPTVFLYIRGAAGSTYMTPDPVVIPVAGRRFEDLPEQAEIGLTGPDEEKANAVRRCLRVTRELRPAYRLEAHDVRDLSPGTYEGLVYLADPPWPLADLRVVVGGTAG
jgi:hypothetical protein